MYTQYKEESLSKSFENFSKNLNINYYVLCAYLLNICTGYVHNNYKTLYFKHIYDIICNEYKKIKLEYEKYLENPDERRESEDLHDYGESFSEVCKKYLNHYDELTNNLAGANYAILTDEWSNDDIEIFANGLRTYLTLGNELEELEAIENDVMSEWEIHNINENKNIKEGV